MGKIAFFIGIILFNTFLFGNPIIHEIEKNGYYEFFNKELSGQFYDQLYLQLDQLIEFIGNHPDWVKRLQQADKEFSPGAENRQYGSPPMGYIDEQKSNKCKKVYFHFSIEYGRFLKEKYPSLFEESLVFSNFIASLEKIHTNSSRLYKHFIQKIESSEFPLACHMYTEKNELALLVKVVRYEKSLIAGSNPHYDFSGVSLLLDNTDIHEETLLLAPYKELVSLDDFSRPKRKYERSNKGTSALLIPGLALKEVGYPLNPTPHMVLNQPNPRYAVISFAMVPDVHLSFDQIKLRQLSEIGAGFKS